ncbi:hypothetical protein PVK06_003428 [Gossypium arboreum]|uniref:Uncharacterized protein n=1 Tax=Gossypium arboreum TaxID=29729 RepID=A0ABR0R6I0_GOSAR|nr:hypothetical protein PVK06_003428 [Gossypium arboreum]
MTNNEPLSDCQANREAQTNIVEGLQKQVEEEAFRPWMLVERRHRGKGRSMGSTKIVTHGTIAGGSRSNFGVRTTTEDDVQWNKPPNKALEKKITATVNLTAIMEEIVKVIEQGLGVLFDKNVVLSIVDAMNDEVNVEDEGIGHLRFHKFVNEYRREFCPYMICFFETRISGDRADGVIARIVFPNSYLN